MFNINLKEFCKDIDMEACAVKLGFLANRSCIIIIYRSPSGNFQLFINGKETIIKKLCILNLHFMVRGGINTNYR